MLNVDKILFNTNINTDSCDVSVAVSYFILKKDKNIGDDIIKSGQKLIGVGICDKTGMINVCYLNGNYHKYFWIKPEEIRNAGTNSEEWEFDDVKTHLKAIKEKWTTEKNTKNDLKQKKSSQKRVEKKGKTKRSQKF
jgi:hypothetical protein